MLPILRLTFLVPLDACFVKDWLELDCGTGEPKYSPVSALKFHTAITSKYYGADYAVDDKNAKTT